jgi:hypothetical protein
MDGLLGEAAVIRAIITVMGRYLMAKKLSLLKMKSFAPDAGASPQRNENTILSPWSDDLPPLQFLERGIEGVRTNRAATAIFRGASHAAVAPPQRNENILGNRPVLCGGLTGARLDESCRGRIYSTRLILPGKRNWQCALYPANNHAA